MVQSYKKLNVQIYSRDRVPLKTLSQRVIRNNITFTDNINGGQGELNLDLDVTPDNMGDFASVLSFMNFVELRKVTDTYPDGRVIYSGYISRVNPVITQNDEYVSIKCIGLASLLSETYWKDGPSFTVSYPTNTDPSQMARDAIDNVLTLYGTGVPSTEWIRYTFGTPSDSVVAVGVNVQADFDKLEHIQAMNQILNLSGDTYFWHIDAEGLFRFREKPTTATHAFNRTQWEKYSPDRSVEEVINSVTVEYSGGGTVISEDATSIDDFGKRERYITQSDFANAATAQAYADRVVADNKDPKLYASLEINSKYDIESVKAGDSCRIFGLREGQTIASDNMVISKINRLSMDKARLTLEGYIGFGDTVANLSTNQ